VTNRETASAWPSRPTTEHRSRCGFLAGLDPDRCQSRRDERRTCGRWLGYCRAVRRPRAITRTTLRFASVFDRVFSLFSEAQASTVPAQVRKSLAVNSRPEIVRKYRLTSPEPTVRRAPRRSRYRNSYCPGISRQRCVIRANRESLITVSRNRPLLPRKRNRALRTLRRGDCGASSGRANRFAVRTPDCRFRFACLRASARPRRAPSRAASRARRDDDERFCRSSGGAPAKAIMRSYLVRSRTSRHFS
jgi:hypothetical protein